MALSLNWTAIDLLTRTVLVDFAPGQITPVDTLSMTIGMAETAQVEYSIDPSQPSFWLDATAPGKAALICWVGDPAAPVPLWGGVVQQRVRYPGVPTVDLQLITMEGYLNACQVGSANPPVITTASDGTQTSVTNPVNQDTLITDILSSSSDLEWSAYELVHVNPSMIEQSIGWAEGSNTSVYAALQALSGLAGGPEWTIQWAYEAGQFQPQLIYGQTVGTISTTPDVWIEVGDLLPSSAITEDYSSGNGANVVTAYGVVSDATSTSGTDDDDEGTEVAPSVTVSDAGSDGRPPWHYVWEPSSVVSDVPTLTEYADAALAQLKNGITTLSAILPNDAPGKTAGIDWFIGDTIGWALSDGLAFPEALTGTARVVGFELDETTMTPILAGVDLG